MSEWIKDRLPKLEEATNEGDVWVYDVEADEYLIRNYMEVKKGQPWMEIPSPPSYVKPKRWRLVHPCVEGCWKLKDADGNEVRLNFLRADEIHEEAAKEIAAIYERVKP